MNKLKFFTGGDPLYIDDIEFSQDAIIEALKGVLSGFSNSDVDTFIISGCTATYDGTIYTIAAGYICFKGEVCKVDAHTSATLSYWNTSITYDADGQQTFDDAVIHETQEVRKAKVYPTDTGSAVAYSSVLRIESKLLTLLASANQWLTTLSFESPFGNNGGVYYDIAYRYNQITGTVNFRGQLKRTPSTSATADVHLFTISVPAYYPSKQQELCSPSVGDNFDDNKVVTLIIKTDGTVWLKASVANPISTERISLDGLSYSL